MKMRARHSFLAILLMGLGVWTSAGRAEPQTAELGLAERLASLRSEVETLYSSIEQKREELRSEMQSLAAQKREVELAIEKEKLRMASLHEAAERQKQKVEAARQQGAELQPVLARAAQMLLESVDRRLPFQREERRAEIKRQQELIEKGLLRASASLGQLWDRVEDELRLTRENGLYRQVIDMGGRQQLAEVLRLGMIMLFFRTPEGQFGKAVCSENGKWEYEPIHQPRDAEMISLLFDSFRKQMRTGWFDLPDAVCRRRVP
jgi:hypothetical protein